MVKIKSFVFAFLIVAVAALLTSFASAQKSTPELFNLGETPDTLFFEEDIEVAQNPLIIPSPLLVCHAAANNFLMLCMEWIEGGYEWQCQRDALATWCGCWADWGFGGSKLCNGIMT